MLCQRLFFFPSAATTAFVAIKLSPLLQRSCVSNCLTILIVIFVTTFTSFFLLEDFDCFVWCWLLMQHLEYQQALRSCDFVIVHVNYKMFFCIYAHIFHTHNKNSCELRKTTRHNFFLIYRTLFCSKTDVFLSGRCRFTISKYTISRLMEMHPVCYCLLCKLTHAAPWPHKYTPRC